MPSLWYTDETGRKALDLKRLRELQAMIPAVDKDECYWCGNKQGLSQCRCPLSHRTCPCGAKWRWDVDKNKGELKLIVEQQGAKRLGDF